MLAGAQLAALPRDGSIDVAVTRAASGSSGTSAVKTSPAGLCLVCPIFQADKIPEKSCPIADVDSQDRRSISSRAHLGSSRTHFQSTARKIDLLRGFSGRQSGSAAECLRGDDVFLIKADLCTRTRRGPRKFFRQQRCGACHSTLPLIFTESK